MPAPLVLSQGEWPMAAMVLLKSGHHSQLSKLGMTLLHFIAATRDMI